MSKQIQAEINQLIIKVNSLEARQAELVDTCLTLLNRIETLEKPTKKAAKK